MRPRTSLVVQWLRHHAFNAGVRVQSLVWEQIPQVMQHSLPPLTKKKKKHEAYLWIKIVKQSVTCAVLGRFSGVRLCATPWTVAHQAPPSVGFSRQEHWSGIELNNNRIPEAAVHRVSSRGQGAETVPH